MAASDRTQALAVTPRAVLLGLLLLPLNAVWLIQIEYVRYSDTPTIPQLFFHCVAALLLLSLANRALGRWRPAWALARGELLVVYAMLVIASNIAGHDQLQILYTAIAYIHARATPENNWANLIHPHLKNRVVVTDPEALSNLLRGHTSLYQHGHLAAWLPALTVWAVVALVVAGTMYCLASLLRRQWDHERLSYPLAEVPLAASDPGGELLRSPTFFAGAVLAAGMQFLNLAHQIWPGVPGINLGVTNLTFSEAPWRFMGTLPICFYPFAFGLSFLLPTDLVFSCWFFFALTRCERMLAGVAGFTDWDGFPYVNQQSAGAFIGFGLFTIWAARAHLGETLRQACGRAPADDRGEPLRYRWAWIGLVLGGLFLVSFTVLLGMRVWVALLYWALLLAIVLAVARVRAEVGLPSIELYQRGADDIMRRAAGTLAYKPPELITMTLLFWLNRTQRNYNLQHQLHGLRLLHRVGGDLRRFSLVVLLATVGGIVTGFWAMLHVSYDIGLEGGRFTGPAVWAFGLDPWQIVARLLTVPVKASRGALGANVFGAAVCGLLVVLRTRFVWWPFHPAGWVVGNSFALQRLWVPLTLTWGIKSMILRYGGLRAYRRTVPFFLGLVIGEFGAGFVRTLIDLAWQLYLPANSGIGGL
ncbi:MAG: hypothetical protein IT204_05340 [Fimbriimonadaceae bacterium]|nr:hypothetical protein [Fimbriimonadaceae bacterium]